MTALHVMAEGGTSSGSGIDSSDTVQNLMTGFNVLAESINNLSVETRKCLRIIQAGLIRPDLH
jgi:hypothetical protein